MAISYEYRYTVQSSIDYKSALAGSQLPQITAQDTQLTYVFPTYVGDYRENNNKARTTQTVYDKNHTTIVEPNFTILYEVRFYMVVKDDTKAPYTGTTFTPDPSNGMPQNPTFYWLGSVDHGQTNITNVMVNNGTNTDQIGNLNIVDKFYPQVNTTSALWPEGIVGGTNTDKFYHYGGKINPLNNTSNPPITKYVDPTTAQYTNMSPINNNGDTFRVYITTKTPNATLNPGIIFTASITNNNKYLDINPNSQNPTPLGTMPYFNISSKRVVPPIPAILITQLQKRSTLGAVPFFAQSYYDYCGLATGLKIPSWLGISVVSTGAGAIRGLSYIATIYSCNIDGTGLKPIVTFTESSNYKKSKITYGPKLLGWISKINSAVLSKCPDLITSPPGGTDSPSIPTTLSTDEERYNPPPHIDARDVSFGQRMLTLSEQAKNLVKADPGHYVNSFMIPQTTIIKNTIKDMRVGYVGENLRTKGLGRIIQDANSATQLNTNLDNLSLGNSNSKGSKLWGFRFMYNPTDITYSTSSNNQIDFTLGTKDPAALLAGNQNVSFQLYFNRIPDMQYLRDYKNNVPGLPSLQKVYGTTISPTAIDGLLNRGTEYDPIEKSLLFGDNYQGYTSDFGYTTATPCWVYLNDNLRYFGSVSSISVYHRVFTLDMIPMFSVVTLSFARYPAVWSDNSARKQSYNDLYGPGKSALANALNPANTVGTGKPTDKGTA